jgi:signal peptidase I
MMRGRTKPPSALGLFFENLQTIVYALALAMVIQIAIVKPFRIPSGSMQPTLLVGDYIITTKWSYGYSRFSAAPFERFLPAGRLFGAAPQRGDLVVFRPETQPDKDFVKRLVGLPGDKIQMIGGVLHINGEAVQLAPRGLTPFVEADGSISQIATYVETLPNGVSHLIFDRHSERDGTCTDQYGSNGCRLDETPVYEVPEGRYFFMGDDRDNSQDSRLPEVGAAPFDHLVGKAQFVFFSFDHTTDLAKPWTLVSSLRGERFLKGVQ